MANTPDPNDHCKVPFDQMSEQAKAAYNAQQSGGNPNAHPTPAQLNNLAAQQPTGGNAFGAYGGGKVPANNPELGSITGYSGFIGKTPVTKIQQEGVDFGFITQDKKGKWWGVPNLSSTYKGGKSFPTQQQAQDFVISHMQPVLKTPTVTITPGVTKAGKMKDVISVDGVDHGFISQTADGKFWGVPNMSPTWKGGKGFATYDEAKAFVNASIDMSPKPIVSAPLGEPPVATPPTPVTGTAPPPASVPAPVKYKDVDLPLGTQIDENASMVVFKDEKGVQIGKYGKFPGEKGYPVIAPGEGPKWAKTEADAIKMASGVPPSTATTGTVPASSMAKNYTVQQGTLGTDTIKDLSGNTAGTVGKNGKQFYATVGQKVSPSMATYDEALEWVKAESPFLNGKHGAQLPGGYIKQYDSYDPTTFALHDAKTGAKVGEVTAYEDMFTGTTKFVVNKPGAIDQYVDTEMEAISKLTGQAPINPLKSNLPPNQAGLPSYKQSPGGGVSIADPQTGAYTKVGQLYDNKNGTFSTFDMAGNTQVWQSKTDALEHLLVSQKGVQPQISPKYIKTSGAFGDNIADENGVHLGTIEPSVTGEVWANPADVSLPAVKFNNEADAIAHLLKTAKPKPGMVVDPAFYTSTKSGSVLEYVESNGGKNLGVVVDNGDGTFLATSTNSVYSSKTFTSKDEGIAHLLKAGGIDPLDGSNYKATKFFDPAAVTQHDLGNDVVGIDYAGKPVGNVQNVNGQWVAKPLGKTAVNVDTYDEGVAHVVQMSGGDPFVAKAAPQPSTIITPNQPTGIAQVDKNGVPLATNNPKLPGGVGKTPDIPGQPSAEIKTVNSQVIKVESQGVQKGTVKKFSDTKWSGKISGTTEVMDFATEQDAINWIAHKTGINAPELKPKPLLSASGHKIQAGITKGSAPKSIVTDLVGQKTKLKAYFRANWDKVITSAERNAIEAYTGSAFAAMNNHLRNGAYASQGTLNYIKNAVRALTRERVDSELLMFRSVSQQDPLHAVNNPQLGDWFIDPGMPSASVDPNFAATWKKGIRVPVEFHVKPGVRGAYVSNISSVGEGESEFLIAPGMRYDVIGWNDDGFLVATVTNPADPPTP